MASQIAALSFRLSRFLLAPVGLLLLASDPAQAAAPANDRFSNASLITGTNVTVLGSNIGASKEGGEPAHAGNPGGSSVWWTWTAPANGELQIKTDGSDFDTLLAVYTGTKVNSLTLVGTNDDHGSVTTSRVRFLVTQGTQYQIAVDGFNEGSGAAVGNVTLTLVFLPGPIVRPANDNFTNRMTLAGLLVSLAETNTMATREADEPVHAAMFGDTSVWFTWTSPITGAARVSTEGSSFDTLLAVYSGTALSNLTEIASNDDIDSVAGISTSAVTFDVEAGEVIQIAVDGYDGASGRIVLQVEAVSAHLSGCKRLSNGQFRFTVSGAAGRYYDIQASGDLNLWGPVTRVFNTNGTVVVTDPVASNLRRRFYRAVLLP